MPPDHAALCRFFRPQLHSGFRYGAWWGTLAGLLLGLIPLRALDPACSVYQYKLRTWHRTNGLDSSAVSALVQTEDQRLWLGTARGIVEFDGTEFRPIGLPGDTGLGSHSIRSLERRKSGGVWLSVAQGGFGSFDGQQFTAMAQADLGNHPVTMRSVHELADGSLVTSSFNGIYRWSPGHALARYLPQDDITCLYEDAQKRTWLGTATGGLWYLQNNQLMAVPELTRSLWRGQVISAVAIDHEGLIWVGTSDGLHCLNPDLTSRPDTGIRDQPTALLVDRAGALWIGTYANGLLRHYQGHFTRIGSQDGLASDHILSLLESGDGSLWIGTEDGLSQLSDLKFLTVSKTEGLAGGACLAVVAAADGGIWAGTNNGLTRIRGNTCTSYGQGLTDGFSNDWIRKVLVARNGDLYLLDGKREVCRFRDGRVRQVWQTQDWPQCLAEDERGILVQIGSELWRLDGEKLVPCRLANGQPVTGEWTNDLHSSADGSLWLATRKGLQRIRRGQLTDWPDPSGAGSRGLFSVTEDAQGNIWASGNACLLRWKDGRVSSVGRSNGLVDELISVMVADREGNFWLDTPGGLYRVAQRELNAVADGGSGTVTCTGFDGPQISKSSEKLNTERSACLTSEGEIWLPSTLGAVRITPSRIPLNPLPPPVRLERVLVDGLVQPLDRAPGLSPGLGNLQFDYHALDYQAPEQVRYRYQLEGYDHDWVDAGGRRSAFYTNLPPGDYRFHVQACNADGVWNLSGAAFPLRLPPRFFQTLWFRLAVPFGLLGLVSWYWVAHERRREQAFAESRQHEALLQQMIEGAPVAMAMAEGEARVVLVNAAFTLLFGYEADELPDLAAWWSQSCRAAPNSGLTLPAPATGRDALEASVTCRDGSVRSIVCSTARVGERTLYVFLDFTEIRKSEEDRLHLEEQLRQGQKMEAIGQLSGGVAHDFNNMLTVILGNLGLIQSIGHLPAGIAESLAGIEEAALRAANLTRQLLAFSRKQPMSMASVELNQVVGDMSRMITRIVGEDIALQLRLSPGSLLVLADASMLEQVLLNLTVNARDAMPAGGRLELSTALAASGIRPPARLRSEVPATYACLSVSDTGCGIAPEVLPHIFEPFYTTKSVGKGTGLGLATVYGIVEQHSGWIDVGSTLGNGTVFRLYLPLAVAESSPAPEIVNTQSPIPEGLGVLVVEDDSSVRSLVVKTLRAQGCRMLEAGSGPEALQLWYQHAEKIDIVLTDVVMPDGMTGLELGRRLQSERPGLRCIYTSGYSPEGAKGQFTGREGIDFLAKPYTPATLLAIIARQVQLKRGS